MPTEPPELSFQGRNLFYDAVFHRYRTPWKGQCNILNVSQMMQKHKTWRMGLSLLETIGNDLDADVYPVVHDGGFVALGRSRRPIDPFPSVERSADGYLTRRSQAREGQGSPRGQGKAGAAAAKGSTGTPAQIVREGELTEWVQAGLEGVERANDTITRSIPAGYRVCWRAGLIRGLPDSAFFCTNIRLISGTIRVDSWAWWEHGVWIGPRHTNYDGSVCAFELTDRSWTAESPLLELFDMSAVWAVKQLHLRWLGRWPGRQILHTAAERLTETAAGELCGCGGLLRYADCCHKHDLARPAYEVAMEFHRFTGGRDRHLNVSSLGEAIG